MKPQHLLKCSYHLKAAWGRRIRVKNVTSGDLTILQDKPNSSLGLGQYKLKSMCINKKRVKTQRYLGREVRNVEGD